jgi:hypothetical protein
MTLLQLWQRRIRYLLSEELWARHRLLRADIHPACYTAHSSHMHHKTDKIKKSCRFLKDIRERMIPGTLYFKKKAGAVI